MNKHSSFKIRGSHNAEIEKPELCVKAYSYMKKLLLGANAPNNGLNHVTANDATGNMDICDANSTNGNATNDIIGNNANNPATSNLTPN